MEDGKRLIGLGVLKESDRDSWAFCCAVRGRVLEMMRDGQEPTAADRRQYNAFGAMIGLDPSARSRRR